MRIDQTFAVLTKGIGAPDYSNTVSSAQERRGLRLKYGQRLKMFGRSLNLGDAQYPLVPSTPLAAGANTHLTDFETLAPTPYTVPAGYTLALTDIGYSFSQDAQVYAYIDFGVAGVTCLAVVEAGIPFYENRITGLTTAWVDPAGILSHLLDVKVYNMGLGNLFGGIIISAILEEVGTEPLPTTKNCHCPFCSNVQTESVHATKIICKNCGHEYGVFDLSGFRGTA